MTDNVPIDDVDDEGALPQKRRRLWVWACLASLLIAGALFGVRSFSHEKTLRQIGETESSAYAMILGETRTGIRLALLGDFIREYPQSIYMPAARAQQRALKTHEQMAWAALTDELYKVELSADDKARAVSNYVRKWSRLSRAADLGAINLDALPPDPQALTFAAPASPYKKGGTDYGLAGARPERGRTVIATPPRPTAVRPAPPTTLQARVRTARRPVYPRKARRKGVTATVTLSLDIDERGRVARTRVVAISASRYEKDFIKAAQKAARRSRFHPKTVRGEAVASSGFIRKYTFNLDD